MSCAAARSLRSAAQPPTAADILLLVEIADSSLAYDRDIKVPLYGRCGIPETWLFRAGPRPEDARHGPPARPTVRALRPVRRVIARPTLPGDDRRTAGDDRQPTGDDRHTAGDARHPTRR